MKSPTPSTYVQVGLNKSALPPNTYGYLVTIEDNTLKHDSLKLGSIIFSYLMRD